MFYFEAVVILLLIYGVYVYAPYVLNNKRHMYTYANTDNYALSTAMVADDFYLPDVNEPRRRKHYPQPRPRPVRKYTPPDFYANQSSMLYYSGLPTGKALSDWSNLM